MAQIWHGVAAVAHAVCAETQTAVPGHPTNGAASQSESHRHEQTRRLPRARRKVAGGTEVRFHCRGLATTWKGRDVDTGPFI